jgi:DNA polymerase I-like protein with 3'-5' exonuclease and polymerase domains
LSLLPVFQYLFSATNESLGAVNCQRIVDPKVAHHLCDTDASESSLELQALCTHHSVPIDGHLDPHLGSVARAVTRCVAEMKALSLLHQRLQQQLTEIGSLTLFQRVEMPLACLLSEMETRGVSIDARFMGDMELQLSAFKDKIEKEAKELTAGGDFNLASPEQVAAVLFDRLRLPPPTNTTTAGRHHSTSEEHLLKIRHLHPLVDLVLGYRACAKVLSTYIHGFKVFICKDPAAATFACA